MTREIIDLRSDTVTRPTEEMREFMSRATVGDDVFGEDPTVNKLERTLAEMFGKESGLFCASGTMANQIAIKAHTRPGDQVICSWAAHIYNYEGGGMAANSGVTAKLLEGERGFFNAQQVAAAISPDDPHFPISRLVSIEDTINKGGGATWNLAAIKEISELCKEKALSFHLDGARLFNSLVARGHEKKNYGAHFDSMSICLSKGLGAPVGSILLGTDDFIKKSHRIRKSFGGGMRQAGIIAAAGLYALEHHVDRLEEDHKNAQLIFTSLEQNPSVESILPLETNIIIFYLEEEDHTQKVLDLLETNGILAFATGPKSIRFVLHLDVSRSDAEKVADICRRFEV